MGETTDIDQTDVVSSTRARLDTTRLPRDTKPPRTSDCSTILHMHRQDCFELLHCIALLHGNTTASLLLRGSGGPTRKRRLGATPTDNDHRPTAARIRLRGPYLLSPLGLTSNMEGLPSTGSWGQVQRSSLGTSARAWVSAGHTKVGFGDVSEGVERTKVGYWDAGRYTGTSHFCNLPAVI